MSVRDEINKIADSFMCPECDDKLDEMVDAILAIKVEGKEVCKQDKCAHRKADKTCNASACTDAVIFNYKQPMTLSHLIGESNE